MERTWNLNSTRRVSNPEPSDVNLEYSYLITVLVSAGVLELVTLEYQGIITVKNLPGTI